MTVATPYVLVQWVRDDHGRQSHIVDPLDGRDRRPGVEFSMCGDAGEVDRMGSASGDVDERLPTCAQCLHIYRQRERRV